MTLTPEELPLVVKALDHYASYLHAVERDDRPYKELSERLQRKPPAVERQAVKRKRA